MSIWILLVSVASAADWNALFASDGWQKVSDTSHADTGPITIDTKTIAGVQCLRGVATVGVPPSTLYGVVADIPAAKKWSSETLTHSRVLSQGGKTVEYYQHLDVPGWTMATDRFWVLRGEDASTANERTFRWDRFDWKTKYPELAAEIAPSGAVEPDPNWGAWAFAASGEGSAIRYYVCSDPGGSLPTWLKETAATKTLPNTLGDVVREGKKRTKG